MSSPSEKNRFAAALGELLPRGGGPGLLAVPEPAGRVGVQVAHLAARRVTAVTRRELHLRGRLPAEDRAAALAARRLDAGASLRAGGGDGRAGTRGGGVNGGASARARCQHTVPAALGTAR